MALWGSTRFCYACPLKEKEILELRKDLETCTVGSLTDNADLFFSDGSMKFALTQVDRSFIKEDTLRIRILQENTQLFHELPLQLSPLLLRLLGEVMISRLHQPNAVSNVQLAQCQI